ncbi:MAG: hypothetical protein A2521_09995 [Deltaproteobacteria bacterium RIFOXYD12_FULL_57_12]|nr:MAG: hypothetical protein A2521_09995 [Deltaproteobacteria bacterium RIFOXYD12_FULL_57_12]
MEVVFLGVGEACDPGQSNTSLLVRHDNGTTEQQVLLDCGFTAAHDYFRVAAGHALDGLWISHFHGDHFFGVPLLLLRFWEAGRTQPFVILGPAGGEARVLAAMDLAYPGMRERFSFSLEYMEVIPGHEVEAVGFRWLAAATDHSLASLAVRLEGGGRTLFYSGDGRPTPATVKLAAGCDLVVHEAFRWQGETPGHGSVAGCLEFTRLAQAVRLALVHIQREERRCFAGEIRRLAGKTSDFEVLLPVAGDIVVL